MNTRYMVTAARPLSLDGKLYRTGDFMRTPCDHRRQFRNLNAVVNWCRKRYGMNWPEFLDIRLI